MKKRQADRDVLRIISKGVWKATVGGARLRALRGDRGFHRLVALMRLTNQIRFVNLAALQNDLTDSPPDRRQLNQSYFFSLALVFEGWALAQRLAQHYRHRDSFKTGLGQLLKDPKTKAFVSNSLKRVRNSAMFHPDEDEIGRCLSELANESEVVMSGVKEWAGTTYYELADVLLYLTLVGPTTSQVDFMTKYRAAMDGSNEILGRYLHAADVLIVDVLRDEKPRFESVKLLKVPDRGGTGMERALRRMRRLP
jgi:hypothetical protein